MTGASKYQQEITDAPASVTLITQDEIQKGGFRSLADILNTVPEFYTTYDRVYQYIGVQGFSPTGDYNTRILVLVDGHRLNDPVFEQAPVSDFPVDLAMIDRVEVIRGPGSSVYGTDAFFAVINVITRDGRQLRGGELSAADGTFNDRAGRASAGGKSEGGLEWLVSASFMTNPGAQSLYFPEYAADNGGTAHSLDGETNSALLAKLAWGDFSFIAMHSNRDKIPPTAPYGTLFDTPGINNQDRHTVLGGLYSLHSAWVDFSARLTYNRYEYLGNWPETANGAFTFNRDTALGQTLGSDLLASKALGAHLVTLGMEWRWDLNQDQENANVSPVPAVILDDRRHDLIQGYYLQDEFHVRKDLIVNAGLRLDRYPNFGSSPTPRLAVIWKPQDGTVLRGSVGEAFRAPNDYERFYTDHVSQEANPLLRPELARSWELNWDQFIGNNLKTTLTGFRTRITGLLEQVTDPNSGLQQYMNQSRIDSTGLDAKLSGKWENGISARCSYTYEQARNRTENSLLDNSPDNLVKAALTLPLPWRRGFATLESNYGSSRRNTYGERVGGATVTNLTLLQRALAPGLDLSASICNLFNVHYADPAGPAQANSLGQNLNSIAQDGVTVRLQATWHF